MAKPANRWESNTHTHTHVIINKENNIKTNLTILKKLGKANYIRDG